MFAGTAAAASTNARRPHADGTASGYVPRRPAETVLYTLVRDHLESFLDHARQHYARGLPRYVEQALRDYLTCGVFAHGFLRLHCDHCRRDLLVAFSCQGRGICPSCAGRRMANTAAHLVDRVLPAVPVRQWVLSLPFELRNLAAFRADVARALGRIFIEAVALEQRRAANIAGSQHAAINHIQRFGGSLNLNLHFHAIIADGVFAPDDAGQIRFHGLPPPTVDTLDRIVRRVRDRSLRWLRKHGLLDERSADDRSNERPEAGALEACADVALRGGLFAALDHGGDAHAHAHDPNARFRPKKKGPFTAACDGFDIQAAVRIEADDDEGRERLVRYCARPCFALDRLILLRDGRVAYRVKYAGRGATHRVMTPIELLARLAALVPPPRYPLLRYHGVLAPHAKWRSAVVPKPPRSTHAPSSPAAANKPSDATKSAPPTHGAPKRGTHHPGTSPTQQHPRPTSPTAISHAPLAATMPPPSPLPTATAPPKARVATSPASPSAAAAATGDVVITDFGISVRHLDRLLGGLLLATAPRVDWAKLLRRTFAIDVLRCAGCGGRLRLLSAITDKATARKILTHLGLPASLAQAAHRDRAGELAEAGADADAPP